MAIPGMEDLDLGRIFFDDVGFGLARPLPGNVMMDMGLMIVFFSWRIFARYPSLSTLDLSLCRH